MLTDMYNTNMESIKKAMKNLKAVAPTSDFWTSLGNESYVELFAIGLLRLEFEKCCSSMCACC